MTFQLATLLFTVSYAISQSLFAEGSHADADLGQLIRRSSRILAVTAFAVFGLAVPAVSLNSWTTSLMRITRRLKPMVASNVVTLAGVCALALAWGHRGLGWVAAAWLTGNLASGAVGLAVLFGERGSARPGAGSHVLPQTPDGAAMDPASLASQ